MRTREIEAHARLAITDLNSGAVHVYDCRSGSNDPVTVLTALHKHPITALK